MLKLFSVFQASCAPCVEAEISIRVKLHLSEVNKEAGFPFLHQDEHRVRFVETW